MKRRRGQLTQQWLSAWVPTKLLLVIALGLLPVAHPFSLRLATSPCSLGLGSRLGTATGPQRLPRRAPGWAQWQAMVAEDGTGAEDDDAAPVFGSPDWRQFRAKLVAQEKGGGGRIASAGWAYETGNMVEAGSLLLGGSELDFGFGLDQQYFHKSVMLVLSHTEDFTRAVLVNRPTSLSTAGGWRIWFGGHVQGIHAPAAAQEAVCLHKLSAPDVTAVSERVIKGIYMCGREVAEKLVEEGKAQQADFWLLIGFAGWGPGQLQMEIDAGSSWHVAAASPVLLNDLIMQAADSKTEEAGIAVWETLMAKIGLAEKAAKAAASFEDRMLREWVREHVSRDPLALESEAMDNLLRSAIRRGLPGAYSGTPVGTILRTSPTSPYVLAQQFLHKALLLVVQDTEEITVAVVLNRQTRKVGSLKSDEGEKRRLIFFGGENDGGGRIVWLTAKDALRDQGIGMVVSPPGQDRREGATGGKLDGARVVISCCSGEEAVDAITGGLATADDFLLVRGFQAWPKGPAAAQVSQSQAFTGLSEAPRGLQAEIDLGRMEIVPGLSRGVWEQLLALAEPGDGEDAPVELGVAAWQAAAAKTEESGETLQSTLLAQRAALGDEALSEYVHFFFQAVPAHVRNPYKWLRNKKRLRDQGHQGQM